MQAPPKGAGTTRQGRPRWLAVVAVVLLVLLTGVAWWFTQARAFPPVGDLVRVEVDAEDADTRIHLDTGLHPTREVRLVGVQPVVAAGELDAVGATSFHVCSPGPEGGIGVVRGDLDRWCRMLRPVSGARLAPGEQVVMTVAVTAPGDVRIEGFRTTYRDGVRFGRQHTGVVVELVEAS